MENKNKKKHSVFAYLSFFCVIVILIAPLFIMIRMASMQPTMREFIMSWASFFQLLWSLLTDFSLVSFILPCIGVTAGILAVKYGRKAESTLRVKFAMSGILFNSILLLISLSYLFSLFSPRTMSGVVTYKHDKHNIGNGIYPAYICIKDSTRPQENKRIDLIYVSDDTYVYEQYGETLNQRRLVSFDSIQLGQVVKIEYINYNAPQFGFITAGFVTILKGQIMEYDESQECNDGHLDHLPSSPQVPPNKGS